MQTDAMSTTHITSTGSGQQTPSRSPSPAKIPVLAITVCLLCLLTGCTHLENGYNATCAGLIDLSQNLDGFFSDPKEDDAYYETRWKIGGGGRLNKDNDLEFAGKNSLKIALPGTKETWGMLIGGSTEKENLFDSSDVSEKPGLINPDSSSSVQADSSSTETESFLRFYTKREAPLKWDFDVGLKYNREWRAFARLRGKRQGSIGNNRYYFAQEFYWRNTGEEFGLKTTFELDQALHTSALLREFIDIHHHHRSSGLDIYAGMKLRTWAGRKMGVGLEWINFLTTNPWDYKFTDFICRIRRSIGREWFEMELTPRMRMRRLNHQWKHEMSVELIFALIFDADHVIKQKNGT
jgi:hypothetical protein